MAEPSAQTVLVIDDSQDIHDLVQVRLQPEGVKLLHAFDAVAALRAAHEGRPDLILLDLDLPGLNGLELCRQFKDDLDLAQIPVIFLTGTVEVAVKVQAFDAGAIDYITKPFDGVELRARVRAALRTKRYHDMLATLARIDGLTGLWNRAYFDDLLASELSLAHRHGRALSVVLMDVDHFKKLNDTYGHPFGDDVLRRVSAVTAAALRQSDYACRYGGEEFALILRETDVAGAVLLAGRIRAEIEALVLQHQGKPVRVTASFGVACTAQPGLGSEATPAVITAAADAALYDAKHGGRNRVAAAVLETA